MKKVSSVGPRQFRSQVGLKVFSIGDTKIDLSSF